MEIIKATIKDTRVIRELAYAIWPTTYNEILSSEQLDYMLAKFYSEESILEQIEQKKQQFFLLKNEDVAVGFLSFEVNIQPSKTKLHKIYVLPELQGSGNGKKLVEWCVQQAKENQQKYVFLNVNRFNKAKTFYEKLGFQIIFEENIEIGNGYLMEDYVMEICL